MRDSDLWIDDGAGQQLNLALLRDARRAPTAEYSDLELAIALARLLNEQFLRYGTDSTHEITDPESREAMRTLVALADRLGASFTPPYRDLSGFRAYWTSHGGYGSWAARRTMVSDLFSPLIEELERQEEAVLRGDLADPISARHATDWLHLVTWATSEQRLTTGSAGAAERLSSRRQLISSAYRQLARPPDSIVHEEGNPALLMAS